MGGRSLTRRGRSARTRRQRLSRRRADAQGFDRGGRRRPFFLSRYFRPVIGVTLLIIIIGLTAGTILVTMGGGFDSDGNSDKTVLDTVVRRAGSNEDTGAVRGKPQYESPPLMFLDTSNDYIAVIELAEGSIRIELFDDDAPIHVNNFLFLVGEGFYDGLTFHRVVPGFVAQAGDPTATARGDAGYVLSDEGPVGSTPMLTLDEAGIMAMARSGIGASSSQFFITMVPLPQLDAQGFTAFGRVIEGMDLVLALPERNPIDSPASPSGARIRSIRIEEIVERANQATAEAGAVADN